VLKSRRDLALENVALRHQLMVLQQQPGRSRLKDRDRLFWHGKSQPKGGRRAHHAHSTSAAGSGVRVGMPVTRVAEPPSRGNRLTNAHPQVA
jgi:hypothetical protein